MVLIGKEEVDKAWKIMNTLNNPPVLIGDYERQIIKADEWREKRVKSISASGKSVAQLGQQKNQSCPPLKVFSDTEVGSSRAAAEEHVDPEFVEIYGEVARAQGMTIAQYLLQLDVHADDELKHPFKIGKPLVRPNEVKDLPTKMQWVHKWYMKESAKSGN